MKISQKTADTFPSLSFPLCAYFSFFYPRIRHRAGKLEIIKRVRVEFRLINVIYNFIIPIKAFFYHLELSLTFVPSLKMFPICLEKDFSCFQVVESNQKSNKFNSASPWSWGERRIGELWRIFHLISAPQWYGFLASDERRLVRAVR